jgi:hypothetical protein
LEKCTIIAIFRNTFENDKAKVMKKGVVLFAGIVISATAMFAQNSVLDIRYDPDGMAGPLPVSGSNLGGGTHSINLYPSSPDLTAGIYEPHFQVTNTAASDIQLKIIRKEVNVPTAWIDQICWPPLCYNASGLEYSTPNSTSYPAPIIAAGTAITTNSLDAELKPRITPDPSSAGYGLYRYYFYDVVNNTYVDSLDIAISYVLGITQQKNTPSITIAPNPADENVTITLNTDHASSVKVVDALGKSVLNETISNGTKSINVSDFKNGVYIVLVESDGKTFTRKLIVRH